MSAAESPSELIDRLRREREFDALRKKAKPARPSVPEHLRPRAKRWQPRPIVTKTQGKKLRSRPAPKPLAHRHDFSSFRWVPEDAIWIGRCIRCNRFVQVAPEKAAELEDLVASLGPHLTP